ncbi:MAG: IS3 family transposase [Paludibacteraceae bacterium]
MCDLFGRSRQAYYQRSKYHYKEEVKEEILLQLVEKQRKLMPKIGGRKLLELIQPRLPTELSIGRDSFFDFLRRHGLLVGKRRRRIKTTYSNHWLHKYPNLIKGFVPIRANQLWVSDITYVETMAGFVYLNLITDAYSRKIVGWAMGETLEAKYTIEALKIALKQVSKGTEGLIHHSDRGVQYCCGDYVKILNKNQVQISMTENGDPRENAIAERVNGILKDEWLNQMKLSSIEDAIKELKRIVQIYNNCRPHASLDMKTPEYAHSQSGAFKKHWKTYYKTAQTAVSY